MKKVTMNGRNDALLYGLKRNSFGEGEKVEFRVPVMTDCSIDIISDEVLITKEYEGSSIKCSFLMPDKDVDVSVGFRSNMMNPNYRPFPLPVNVNGDPSEKKTCEARKCPACGEINTHKYKFCTECGSPLEAQK